MVSFKALCLVGVASLVATSALSNFARAADLLQLPPPPPVYAPPPSPVAFSGFYLRGDVGEGNLQLRNGDSTFAPTPSGYTDPAGNGLSQPYGFNQNYDATAQATVDFGAGYKFNNYFRADVTGEYRFGSKFTATEGYAAGATYAGGADEYKGRISNGVILANGYVDLGTWWCLTPYIGAGVGVAFNQFSGVTDSNLTYFGTVGGAASANSTTSLAYAFMAGFSYDLTRNLKLDIGYRYLDMGRIATGQFNCYNCNNNSGEVQHYHLDSNDVRIGLRYAFADLLPPPPPVIARY